MEPTALQRALRDAGLPESGVTIIGSTLILSAQAAPGKPRTKIPEEMLLRPVIDFLSLTKEDREKLTPTALGLTRRDIAAMCGIDITADSDLHNITMEDLKTLADVAFGPGGVFARSGKALKDIKGRQGGGCGSTTTTTTRD